MRKKFIYVLWALVVGVLLVIALIFTAIAKGWIGYVPPIEELENPNLKFATEIISDDGKMLGTWSGMPPRSRLPRPAPRETLS